MAKTAKPRDPFADKTPRDWFRIERPKALTITIDDDDDDDEVGESDDPTSADVYIYDVIGGWFGIEAVDFVRALASLDVEQLNLYVNSPGGDVFDATAIAAAIRRHPANVTATVDGIAASAASFVITAADEVVMSPGSSLMIHDAWVVAAGNAQDMRDTADILDKLSDNIAGMYAAKAGGTVSGWRQVMLNETWLNADEAVEMGLADRLAADPAEEPDADDSASNVFDLHIYAHASRADAPAPSIAALRAVALGPTSRPRGEDNLAPAPADATEPAQPAEAEGDPIMGDTKTAAEPENKTEGLGFSAETMQAFAAAMATATASAVRDELKPFLAQAPAAASPGVPGSFAPAAKVEPNFRQAMQMFANRKLGTLGKEGKEIIEATLTDGAEVFNALTNVSLGNATAGGLVNTTAPQWIGELVTKLTFPTLWDLISHDDLTAPNVQAFVSQTDPTGGTKTDGGGAVVSTGQKWVLQSMNVLRWAGADSFDRTPFDFGIEASALASYFRIQLRNYKIWRDQQLVTAMMAGVTSYPNGPYPTGSVIPQVANQILDGVITILNNGGGVANLAALPVALFKTLIKSSWVQAPAFVTLDLGELSEGELSGKITVRPDLSGTVPTGQALVANGQGIQGYELPDVPVRAEQLQVSIGNIDVGLFGYCLPVLDSTNYIALVSQGS